MFKQFTNSKEYVAHRGHMVSFLMMALMITTWVNTFQQSVNAAMITTYF